jgi:microcystin-dependent protein
MKTAKAIQSKLSRRYHSANSLSSGMSFKCLITVLILLTFFIVRADNQPVEAESVDALFIGQEGNVGIGTTNPTDALEVKAGRIKDKTGFVMPVGTILPYGGKEVPIGWLECNGNPVSQEKYSDLFGAIGTLWGKGDKPKTFNLPDLRGQFLRGQDHGANVDPDCVLRKGKPGGANKDAVGSYQGDEIKTHKHDFNFIGVRYINSAYGGPNSAPKKIYIQGAQDDHNQKDIEIKNYGGQETRPKNAYVIFIIKY